MMNCAQAQARLLDWCYRDLPTDIAGDVEKHLTGCLDCQKARAALAGLGRLLDQAMAPPHVNVDIAKLYGEAHRRRLKRTRRWRLATALAGLAAAVVLLFIVKWEVRVDGQQVVLRWGTAPEAPTLAAPQLSTPAKDGAGASQVTPADLRLALDLIHALAADVESRDSETQEALRRLSARLEFQQAQAQARWEATERFVSALNTIQIALSESGGQR